MEIGKKIWVIADGYIPAWSNGPAPELTSHEAVCILNAGKKDAHIELMLYYADKDPVGPYQILVKAERTLHLRVNNLKDPVVVPTGVSYSGLFISDVPVVLQHTRLDSRQSENALISTIAYAQ